MTDRAQIIDPPGRWIRAARIRIDAPAARIFDLIADPAMHARFDGSGTVQGVAEGPSRLQLGSRFGMSMRIGVAYRMGNEVVEFEPDRRIAWHHLGRHRWRYELEPIDDAATLVTETFDGSTARLPAALALIGAYDRNQAAIEATLERLKQLAEAPSGVG